ncbi:aminopeptidase P family N-terminal domain-containing protein, partial [Candidatus Daviesbacteria bacterium]|nr:aminopeptidase P family N-terminal domain-containing protein [Candidatus Daviesbacteria bacterium]
MFEHRVKKLRDHFAKENLDAVLVSSVSSIEYLTGYGNFSKEEREAYIFLGKNFSYIITDGRYSEAIRAQ